MLACCSIRIRITLNTAMIRHGYRFMSPFCSCLYIFSDRCHSIHRTHRGMQVEFDPLLCSIIFAARRCGNLAQIRRNHDELRYRHKPIHFDAPSRPDPLAISKLIHYFQIFLVLGEQLHLQRICKVGQIENKQGVAVAKLFPI
ncbi:hypothetical protein D3C77_440980 [compost metagenome]